MLSLAPRAQRALLSTGRYRAVRRLHVSCAAMQPKDATPAEAYQLMKEEGIKYLDVRTVEEFSAGHAPSALNVPVVFPPGMQPNPGFLAGVAAQLPDKQAALLVGCKSGRRSMMAIDALSQAGYTSLTNVTGGFDLWLAQGLPVEK